MEYEIWVTHSGSPCAVCASYAGRTWPVGVGPQPVVDTHEFCRCTREPTGSATLPQWDSSADIRSDRISGV